MPTKEHEPFVDADVIAAHTGMSLRMIKKWAREGRIPAHPVSGAERLRKTWRFKLSEVDSALVSLRASPIVAVRPGSSAESE